MKRGKLSLLTLSLLILGTIASLILLASRISAEQDYNRVACAVYYEDILLLAEESGSTTEDWLAVFSSAQVCYVIFTAPPDTDTAALLAQYSLVPAGYVGGNSAFATADVSWPENCTTPYALVENSTRTAVFYPDGFNLNGYEGALVKALYLNDYYASLYTPEAKGTEIGNLLFRAVVDRGIRLLLLRPFTNGEDAPVTDPAVYTETLATLSDRLEARGLLLGPSFSTMDTEPFRPLLMACAGCLTAGLWLCLFAALFPRRRQWLFPLGIAAILCLLCGYWLVPALAQKGTMLLCAIVFPCLAVYCLHKLPEIRAFRRIPNLLIYPSAICLLAGWSILGGLAVGALMSDRCCLMGDVMFSGVKIAQLLPLLFCFILFGPLAARDIFSTPLTRKKLLLLVGCALALASAGVILVVRSGDVSSISSLETTFRNTLERTLFVRPRTKELLIAVPFSAILFTRAGQKSPILALPASLCCCLECVSVVNTFCHAVAPIYISVIRTLLAVGLGLIPGIAIFVLVSLVSKLSDPK